MELNWPISVGPPSFVDIPIILLDCDADATAQWRAMKRQFEKTGKADEKWKEYLLLAEQKRFRLHLRGQASYGFPEFHTALQLTNQGFECWSGVQFFDYGRLLRKEGLRK